MTKVGGKFWNWVFDKPDVANTLRTWRGDCPARKAAEALGVSVRTYEGWEQGRGPTGSTLALLLKLVGIIKIAG
jgi:transcriptional regulator with XRE-family HTH domain